MAKVRILKRKINNACTELFTECVIASQFGGKANRENVNAILTSIIETNNDYIKRVSHPEPGMTAKAYYKYLKTHFNKTMLELIDQLSNLI